MAVIYNETPNTLISGTVSDDSIQNHGVNVTISGNYGNNEISNDGNKVSINGVAGNDSILGGDGKDIIYGFDNDDMLQITGEFTTAYSTTAKVLYFKVGSTAGALTIKNFTATTFNINGDNYQLNNNKLVKK